MLLINQRLDKLAAARSAFVARGMLAPERLALLGVVQPKEQTASNEDEGQDVEGGRATDERVLADVKMAQSPHCVFANVSAVAQEMKLPLLPTLLRNFLNEQLGPEEDELNEDEDGDDILSDICGRQGMRREWIRCTPSWRNSGPRYDCVYLVEDESKPGFHGLNVVRLKALLSFCYEGTDYPCAVVEWFKKVGRTPDPTTGMWVVKPDMSSSERDVTVVHIDSILRSAHLLPVYGSRYPLIPPNFKHSLSLDCFNAYYVNKYIDHHANEIAF
ncbi:hypothetical protein EST38_g13308 [Candolleomyces aberdarensis]|uniref:Uncharacterized protein n=1 Tax=Candolleomyces aberdarensis TaxID=2316362 RepID=A0A4Q2D265_9AGAR|nr:hypothetical protein EST38_g13308 [Candolleomyces aberdarensis]